TRSSRGNTPHSHRGGGRRRAVPPIEYQSISLRSLRHQLTRELELRQLAAQATDVRADLLLAEVRRMPRPGQQRPRRIEAARPVDQEAQQLLLPAGHLHDPVAVAHQAGLEVEL